MLIQFAQRNAEYRPDDVAIVHGGEHLSFSGLLERIERCAGGMANCGIGRDSRVALLMENCPEYVISFFAVLGLRAINVPLNIDFSAEELAYYFENADVSLIIADKRRSAAARSAVESMHTNIPVIEVGAEADRPDSFRSLESADRLTDLGHGSPDDDVLFIYSSGSTGRPKCVPRTLNEYWWETDDVIESLRLTRDDVIFCCIPFFHNFGSVHCMLASAGAGARLVILDRPNPFALRRNEALKLLEAQQATILPGVPFMFDQLAQSNLSADLSRIRICYSAAAALSPRTVAQFEEKFGIPIRQHYGCTEVGVLTIDLDPDPDRSGTTVGKPFPGVSIRIEDEHGQPCKAGEPGEIVVSSRHMTRGYLDSDETNELLFRDGSFYTGDLGQFDSQGRLCLKGRKKLIIDIAGQKVSPIEVEDVLNEHPCVDEAVVIGVQRNDDDTMALAAFVLPIGECSQEDLLAHCRTRLAHFKTPRRVTFISEIPRNKVGKIIRDESALTERIIRDAQVKA